MIIPMKKIIILTLKKYENQTLEELRDLGVLHLNNQQLQVTDAQDRLDLVSSQASLERVIGTLEQLKLKQNNDCKISGKELFEKAEALLNEKEVVAQELEFTNKSVVDMEDWGEFDFGQLENYQKQGLRLYLCHAPDDDKLKDFASSEDCHLIELNRGKSGINFVLVSTVKLDKAKLPLANISSEKSLSQLKKEAKDLTKKLNKITNDINDLAKNVNVLNNYKANLAEEIEFFATRDAMSLDGEVAYIDGYVPETKMKELEIAAKSNTWGYLAQDAERTPDVPTYVEMPKFAKIITPLFDFLAINPGYHELDVSGAFVLFFSIFFGMLIGDAGYGAIFLILAIVGLIKFKDNAQMKAACKLVTMLSIFAITWGCMTNNVFALEIPGLGIPALSGAANAQKDANTQFFCFALGLVHLSIGHFWQAILDFKWRNIGTQLGWLAVLVGNFILISALVTGVIKLEEAGKLMMYSYGIGIALIATCEVKWTDMSSIFGFPFGLVNSFVDLLSYIRLFAVGLAGFYLAKSFNDMAPMILGQHPNIINHIVFGIVLLFGHGLNIALAMLSVLVHGVRLNTLEFSGHVGLQWTGFKYKPFKKNK